jgi:hypothetical protein
VILLGLLVGSSLVSSALRAQPLPVPSSVGAPSVRLGNVEAAYIPYVPAAGDVAPPAGPVPGIVEVPVYGRNTGRAEGLVLTVDYDQVFLRFEAFRRVSDGWIREQVSLQSNLAGSRVRITFRRYSGRAVENDGEDFLIGYVQFALNEVDSTERAVSPRTIAVRLQGEEDVSSYYYRFGPNGSEVRLDTDLTDGRITLFFVDGVSLGSGVVSPVEQDISLPLYLTVLKPTDAPIQLTVDYDQVFLRYIRALPFAPEVFRGDGIVDDVQPEGEERPAGAASVRLTLTLNPEAINGPLLRRHVADLYFTFTGEAPGDGRVDVTAGIVATQGPAEPQAKGGKAQIVAHIQVASPYFVRGNVSSVYDVLPDGTRILSRTGLQDVGLILHYLTAGGDLPCRVAADIDASGKVNLTDAVMLIEYLYGSGPFPRAPFPEAGWLVDHEVELGCEKSLPYYQPKQ